MSFACRRFRASFTPGSPAAHRRQCPACEAYAAALEEAAGVRLPLPAALRQRLLALPGEASPERTERPQGMAPVEPFPEARPEVEAGAVLGPRPVPQLPLPQGLRGRLLALPRRPEARPRPPVWVLQPRYAIAASYLAAVLLGAAIGDPAELGRRVARGVGQVLAQAETAGEARLEELEEAASTRYRRARRSVETSVDRLGKKLPQIPSRLVPAATDRDPRFEERNDSRGSDPNASGRPEEDDASRPARGRERRLP